MNNHEECICYYEDHEKMFRNNSEEDLTLDQQKQAWAEYERDKNDDNLKGKQRIRNMLRK